MATSCNYPDKKSDELANCSDMLSEQLAHFDLACQYAVLLEEEVDLFFATIFRLDPLSRTYKEAVSKGRTVRSNNSVVYCWNDIPVVEIRAVNDPYGEYGFEIECHRLYDPDMSRCL